MFAEDHGVIIADRRGEQTLGVGGISRGHHFDARYRGQQRVKDLRVLRARAGAGADHGADHHRRARLAAKHIAELGNLIQNLVKAYAQKIDKHELCNGAQPR